MYRLNMIVGNLINNKISPGEIEIVLDGLIRDSDECPCRILGRPCDRCPYKSINQRKEQRTYSGCVDAIEYYVIKTIIDYNYPYIIRDTVKDKMITWGEILYNALFKALEKYPKHLEKLTKEWVF